MKKFFSLFIACVILLHSFSSLVTIISYEVNKEYITNKLCVNREKPESCCEGKCFLKKELNEQEQKEQSALPSLKEKQELVQFFESRSAFRFIQQQIATRDFYCRTIAPDDGHYLSVFHPPSC